MQLPVIGVHVRPGGRDPLIQIQYFVHWAFPLANFFLKYFVRKNWQSGLLLLKNGIKKMLLKNGTLDGYAYYPCYFRAGFTLRETPGTLGIFATFFLLNIGEDQKKAYHLSARPLHCAIW